MISIAIKFLIFIHFAWHAIAAIGVTAAIWHSYEAHRHSKWKLMLAVLWLIVSVALLFVSDDACH
jgi:hypothetical protein